MNSVDEIERRNPEWHPWLEVVRDVLSAVRDPAWDRAVPARLEQRRRDAPLLAETTFHVDTAALERCWTGLQRAAGIAPADGTRNVPEVMLAALDVDEARLDMLALDGGVDEAQFKALAAMLPVPLLQACCRKWTGAIPESWSQGHCPLCGAWPAYAEVCGVDRERYLRCGRCGAAYRAEVLACAYCGERSHEALRAFVVEHGGASRSTIEACTTCSGYLKSFNALRAGPAEQVMVEDLATVELDIAATVRGFRRPHGTGFALRPRLAGLSR